MTQPRRSTPPKLYVPLSSVLRLSISALRCRGRTLPGGLHFALEEATDDGFERLSSFIVPRGTQLDRFFTALERAEADAIAAGWWPAEDQPVSDGEAA